MAIKKLTVSFDLPVATFLSMLAAGNSGMKIDVFADDHTPKQRRLNGNAPKLLEGPPKDGRGGSHKRGTKTGYRAIFDLFAAHPEYGFRPIELQPAVVGVGLNAKSVSPQLTKLRQDGNVKRTTEGKYQITPRGVATHAKLVASETAEASNNG